MLSLKASDRNNKIYSHNAFNIFPIGMLINLMQIN